MAAPTKKPPTKTTGNGGKSTTMGNKGGVLRGQARAAQVQARNAARKAAKGTGMGKVKKTKTA